MSNVLVGQTSSSYNIVKGESTLNPWERVTYIPGGVRLESNVTGAVANIADRIFKIIYQKVGYQVTIQLLAYNTSVNPNVIIESFKVENNPATLSFDAALLGTKIVAQSLNDRTFKNRTGDASTAVQVNAIGGVYQPANVNVLGNVTVDADIAFHITGLGTILESAVNYRVCSATFIADNAKIVV